MNTDLTLEKLVETLQKRGGHVNKYYLSGSNRNKRAIVFLNEWYAGKNLREALLKALA